jgi:fatty-acid peroxygenase
MLREAICTKGPEAAEMFYGTPDRFTRVGAMPVTVLKLLQDVGSVQTLQGQAHRHRKRMFMSALAPALAPRSVESLADLFAAEWRACLPEWERSGTVIVFDEARSIITRAVCAWAGVPLEAGEDQRRAFELSEMIESTGSFGPRNWRAQMLRARSERWARGKIAAIRAGSLDVPEHSAAAIIADHRDLDGKLLDVKVAAVELLNVLRPTVAVARFIVFAAVQLEQHPMARERIRGGDEAATQSFAEEVRRHSPFFPFVGGRVLQPFDWRGHRFAKGAWIIIDIFGTNRDPRSWDKPDQFRPERFLERTTTPYEFIPQSGGEHFVEHRCPGEWITVRLIVTALGLLTREMQYDVHPQDLTVELARIPAIPKSGFAISNVTLT